MMGLERTATASAFGVLLILFASVLPAGAQAPARFDPTPDADLDRSIHRGIELAYNLQFEESEAEFGKVIERFPDHPMGYFFLGMTFWSRYIVDYDDTASHDRCHQLLDRAIELGEKNVSGTNPDPWLYFYLGGAEGFKGQILLNTGHLLGAYIHGRRGKNYLERAVELDPELIDANLGLGIYHYYAATLPRFIRFFARLLNLGGDRDKGLAELRLVLDKGRYTAHHARMVLQVIYTDYEQDNESALRLIEENRRLFPRNHWYDIYLEKVLISMGEYRRAIPFQERFVELCRSGSPYFKPQWIHHIRFRTAVCRFRLDELDESKKIFERLVADDPDFPAWIVPYSRLQIGMIHDLANNHAAALTHYRRVLDGPNEADVHDRARDFIRQPYAEGDQREYPLYFWNLDTDNYWGYRNRSD